jgi:DNA-binding beta-propeller fold protein YncE
VSEDVVVSPDGSRVYVAGRSWTFTTGWNIVTVAYETSLGLEQWVARYTNKEALLGGQDDWDPLMAIAPDGGRLFVTGTAVGTTAMVTLAYDTDELAD